MEGNFGMRCGVPLSGVGGISGGVDFLNTSCLHCFILNIIEFTFWRVLWILIDRDHHELQVVSSASLELYCLI